MSDSVERTREKVFAEGKPEERMKPHLNKGETPRIQEGNGGEAAPNYIKRPKGEGNKRKSKRQCLAWDSDLALRITEER